MSTEYFTDAEKTKIIAKEAVKLIEQFDGKDPNWVRKVFSTASEMLVGRMVFTHVSFNEGESSTTRVEFK